MQVLGPKGPLLYAGTDERTWAVHQIHLAAQILDNPGGGLVFATQTMGQVRAALLSSDEERWEKVVDLLMKAEEHAVRRELEPARRQLELAEAALTA